MAEENKEALVFTVADAPAPSTEEEKQVVKAEMQAAKELEKEPDVQFEALVQLPEVAVETNEENEDVEFKM